MTKKNEKTKNHATSQGVNSSELLDALLNISDYDCGLMNDCGGGQVSWWHDYIRYEINRCNEHWREEINSIIE